jgi:hypothetical protein
MMASGAASTAGTLRFQPGRIRKAVTISALLVRLSSASAGGNFQLGLYAADSATGKPTGSPLFQSGSISTTATGEQAIACSLVLSPGMYWVAVQTDNAVATFVSQGALDTLVAVLSGTPASVSPIQPSTSHQGFTKAGVFGTFPVMTGVGDAAPDSLVAAATRVAPVWGFQVA